MRTRLLLAGIVLLLLLAACRTTDIPQTATQVAEVGASTATVPVAQGTAKPTDENLATQRAEALATLPMVQTATAMVPTPTPGPVTPSATPTATLPPTQTPIPTFPPPGFAGGAGGGGMGGGCSQGCGGGGGGAGGGGGGEYDPYPELGPAAGVTPEGPVPTPHMMYFQDYGTNPFVDAVTDPLSTFAAEADTGSYTLTRRYLNQGLLPPPEAVRLEEYINYFGHDYPIPTQEEVFSIQVEAAPTIFNAADTYVLRVGIQGYQLDPAQRPDANLMFVIDVSGSMDLENRLEAVKLALNDLVDQLRPSDTVGIVAYSTDAYLVLSPTPVEQADTIKVAINQLHPLDSTNVQGGLLLGYTIAYENFDPARINRVILCSDGVANVGDVQPDQILATVRDYAQDDLMLTTVGFGMGNYNDVLMEQLADNGGGQYYYVDSYPEARRLFVDELTSTLVTIARDVKIQVQFNPETVAYYRLMGYENRDIADADFRNDDIDAGEIGSGHSVTALYEIVPTDYNRQGVIATVNLRWIDPATGAAREMSRPIEVWERQQNLDDASARFQLDIAAAFADLIGDGAWSQQVSWADLQALAAWLVGGFPDDPDVVEFEALVRRAAQLSGH